MLSSKYKVLFPSHTLSSILCGLVLRFFRIIRDKLSTPGLGDISYVYASSATLGYCTGTAE